MEEYFISHVFGENLLKLGAKYKNMVVLDTDFSSSAKTSLFAKNYANRHFCFGRAEQNLVSAAGGFAIRGKLPFVCADALFLTGRAYTQIRNVIAYPNLNVKLVGFDAGLALGKDGAIRHSLEDVALMRAIPNMQIFSPADGGELTGMMKMMMETFGPMYLRLSAVKLTDVSLKTPRGGSDICVFTNGSMLKIAQEVAMKLANQISVRVMNVSTVRPLNEAAILKAASSVKFSVSLEDHFVVGGLGSALAELFAEKYPTRLYRMGVESFTESGSLEDLYDKYALSAVKVEAKLRYLWAKYGM